MLRSLYTNIKNLRRRFTKCRATPGEIDTDLSTLQQGQADANANMEHYMAMNANMMESLSSQVEFRRTLEEQLNMFAQHVQDPVTQAVNNSTTAANLTNERAGAYVSMRQELTNAFNAAQQANADAETSRLEMQRQLAQATAALADATATAISRRQPSDITATAERLAVQLAELRTDDAQARDEAQARATLRPSTQSTFGTRYNAFTAAPSNVSFRSPVTQAP
jgi:chromosome segregation ATPase